MSTMVHKESQETKDFIADWIAPNFFFSKKDVWHRFGMLGVFGDFVLSCTPGDVAEIGVGESSIYLSHVARKYSRRIFHCDISASKIINPSTIDGYLTEKAMNLPEVANGGALRRAVSGEGNSFFYVMSSDEFFNEQIVSSSKLALAFVDGDHIYEQAAKDFWNFVPLMVENGYIILHDTMPPSEEFLREEACGGVWNLRRDIESDPRFDCITLPKGCAIGVGLTIVRIKPKVRPFYNE